MMSQLRNVFITFFILGFLNANAGAVESDLQTNSKKAYMIYWYEAPRYPGDGESTYKDGTLVEISYRNDILSARIDFTENTKESEEFDSHNGWMSQIAQVVNVVKLIPDSQKHNEGYYGSQKGLATILFKNGTTQEMQTTCLQVVLTEKNFPKRGLTCYLNGNDSVTFYSKK